MSLPTNEYYRTVSHDIFRINIFSEFKSSTYETKNFKPTIIEIKNFKTEELFLNKFFIFIIIILFEFQYNIILSLLYPSFF
jgi:hypothetical protein